MSRLLGQLHPAAMLFAAGFLFWGGLSLAQAAPALRWVTATDAKVHYVEATGFGDAALRELKNANFSPAQWQRILSVFAEQGSIVVDATLPPMLGIYSVQPGGLRFTPQFPLERGVKYRAVFRPNELPGGRGGIDAPVASVFQLPARSSNPTTTVVQIYPTAEVLPENLLKFYVHFSAPMSRGHIYDHIHLRDEKGKAVELPFLEIDEELWNPELTRLTLFIDPGRIKRGVKPLEEIGPALEKGKKFTLVIGREWHDAAGDALKEPFTKRFQVGPTDRRPPDPARWKITAPKSSDRKPLTIVFDEPMDQALALRMIRCTSETGVEIAGRATLEDQERRWLFVPEQAWKIGAHRLVVQTIIEDLAGNNIGKPFEVDLFEGVQRRLTNTSVKLPFEVR